MQSQRMLINKGEQGHGKRNDEKPDNKISVIFLLIQSQIGVVLSLPHAVQESAKGDGWISTLIAGLAVQVMLIVYWQLLKRFPTLMYTEITKKLVGRFLEIS